MCEVALGIWKSGFLVLGSYVYCHLGILDCWSCSSVNDCTTVCHLVLMWRYSRFAQNRDSPSSLRVLGTPQRLRASHQGGAGREGSVLRPQRDGAAGTPLLCAPSGCAPSGGSVAAAGCRGGGSSGFLPRRVPRSSSTKRKQFSVH